MCWHCRRTTGLGSFHIQLLTTLNATLTTECLMRKAGAVVNATLTASAGAAYALGCSASGVNLFRHLP